MPAPEPVDYIDPFIGSVAKTKYYGRTFPGATRPFGMVSVDATGREKYTTGFRIDANR